MTFNDFLRFLMTYDNEIITCQLYMNFKHLKDLGERDVLPAVLLISLSVNASTVFAQQEALGNLADVGALALPDDATVWRGLENVARLLAVAALRVPIADDRVAIWKSLHASQYRDIDVVKFHVRAELPDDARSGRIEFDDLSGTSHKRVAARQTDGADRRTEPRERPDNVSVRIVFTKSAFRRKRHKIRALRRHAAHAELRMGLLHGCRQLDGTDFAALPVNFHETALADDADQRVSIRKRLDARHFVRRFDGVFPHSLLVPRDLPRAMLPCDQYVAVVKHPHVLRMSNRIVPDDFALFVHDENVIPLMAGAEKFVRPVMVFMPEIAFQTAEPFQALRIVRIDIKIRPDQLALLLQGRLIESA